jgi:hypothetical protein
MKSIYIAEPGGQRNSSTATGLTQRQDPVKSWSAYEPQPSTAQISASAGKLVLRVP